MYQQPLFLPPSSWTMPSELPDLSAAKMLAIDTETKDLNLNEKGPGFVRGESHIVGISVCTDDLQFCRYFPIRHEDGPNLPPSVVLDWARDQLKNREQPKVTAHGIYDLEALHYDGVPVLGKIHDVQIAEPLLNEESLEGYSLDVLAKKYLGVGKDEELLETAAFFFREGKRDKRWLKDMKGKLHRFPARFVGPYAEIDALRTMEVFFKQLPLMAAEQLERVYDVETRLTPLLLAMRIKGVPFDVEAAGRKSIEWRKREKQILDEVTRTVGRAIDPWAPSDMVKVFDHYSIEILKTDKGNPSFENEVMENLGVPISAMKNPDGSKRTLEEKIPFSAYPAIQMVVAYRKLNKMRRDFVDGYQKMVVRGKIHAEFHPLRRDSDGTRSGRVSSSNPNLQQVPHRDPIYGPEVRSLFVPEKGLIWVKRDFNQQEPRLTVHYAHLRRMGGSEHAWKEFSQNPFTDYHALTASMAGISRAQAKSTNLGLAYGAGRPKIAAMLGMTMSEADELFKKYHERLPYMKLLAQETDQYAQNRGYIRTLLGRRKHFDFWEPRVPFDKNKPFLKAYPLEKAKQVYDGMPLKRAMTRNAMNSLIQGGGADLTKMCMVVEYEEFEQVPYAQVHDELDNGMESLQQAVKMRDVMENAMPEITVPMIAEIEHGENWGYLTKYEDERKLKSES